LTTEARVSVAPPTPAANTAGATATADANADGVSIALISRAVLDGAVAGRAVILAARRARARTKTASARFERRVVLMQLAARVDACT
jgi:hypothetical protein